MNIITGATGVTHVTSNNDGEFNQAIFGDGLVVLANGNQLDAEIVNNNLIAVKDGDLVMQGRHALIEPGTEDEITISTGTVDTNRNDLIVARYRLDNLTGYESLTLEVIEGAESSGPASDPAYTDGVIRTGATLVEYPLYRVRIEGINIVGLDKLFEPMDNLTEEIAATKILANSVQTQVTELKEDLGLVELWSNVEASSLATGTTITIPNLSDYKTLRFIGDTVPGAWSATFSEDVGTQIWAPGVQQSITPVLVGKSPYQGANEFAWRGVTVNLATNQIIFGQGYVAGAASNAAMMVRKIYGQKY